MRLSGLLVCAFMHLIDLCLLRAIPAHAESQSAFVAPRLSPGTGPIEGEAKVWRVVEIAKRYDLDRRTIGESSGWQSLEVDEQREHRAGDGPASFVCGGHQERGRYSDRRGRLN